jgi:hypothetical protein
MKLYSFILLFLLCSATSNVFASDDINNFYVQARIASSGEIIVNQPVVIELEILSKTGFPTKVDWINPSVENIVYLPNRGAGVNGTKNIENISWISQLHQIILYPTQPGQYQIPSFILKATFRTGENSAPEATLTSNELSLKATLPSQLNNIPEFITSPKVTVDSTILYKGNIEDDLSGLTFNVGDAITKTLKINAESVPGMMLPTAKVVNLNGVSVYQKPAKLDDKYNRGRLLGSRYETITYIFEETGNYQIPEQNIYWWDLAAGELKTITLPAQKFNVSGLSSSKESQQGPLNTVEKITSYLYWLGIVVLIFILVGVILKYKELIIRTYQRVFKVSHHKDCHAFKKAVKLKDYKLACDLLYKLHHLPNDDTVTLRALFAGSSEHQAILNKLFSNGYSNNKTQELSLAQLNLLLKPMSKRQLPNKNNYLILNRR